MRHVCALNGVDGVALTKIDVLEGVDPLRICVAYEVDGRRIEEFPADIDLLRRAKPVYREMPGFTEPLKSIRRAEDLPRKAAAYVEALAKESGARILLLSVGPDREETLALGAR
jgi:adenylosuccinate synthase